MPTSWQSLETTSGPVAAADVLDGFLNFAASGGPTTLITVPAGRTWSGDISLNCSVAVAAATASAGQATVVVATAGTGVTPAAGTVLRCDALAGANAAGGTVGSDASNAAWAPLTVVAPVGNSVTVTATATIAGTTGSVNVTAVGALQ